MTSVTNCMTTPGTAVITHIQALQAYFSPLYGTSKINNIIIQVFTYLKAHR